MIATTTETTTVTRVTGRRLLVRLLERSMRPGKGLLYVPAGRTTLEEGQADTEGLLNVGCVEAVSPEWDGPAVEVGMYVVVRPDGGRGAHGDGRRWVFYGVDEVLARVEV